MTRLDSCEATRDDRQNIKNWLKDIAENTILPGRGYDVRIDIEDGGYNSYIGLHILLDNFQRKAPVTRDVALYRHTNHAKDQHNAWKFSLGGVCNPYADNPDIELYFGSYGKTISEAAEEARPYLSELKRLIKKEVKRQNAELEEERLAERTRILERLKELDDTDEQT